MNKLRPSTEQLRAKPGKTMVAMCGCGHRKFWLKRRPCVERSTGKNIPARGIS